MGQVVKFYRPPTKKRLIAHLGEFHEAALAHLAPTTLDGAERPSVIIGAALRSFRKGDLNDLHRLIHLGIDR